MSLLSVAVVRSRADEGDHAAGARRRRWARRSARSSAACSSIPPAGRACSGSTPRSRRRCVPLTLRDGRRSRAIRTGRARSTASGTVLDRAHPRPGGARAQQGQRLGLGVRSHARMLRGLDRRRPSLFVARRAAGRRPRSSTLRLLRNRVLVGATLAILIVAGTINALMYVLSLYFQDPAALGMSALEAGLATLPAAAAHDRDHAGDHAARGQDRRRPGRGARLRSGRRRLRGARVRRGVLDVRRLRASRWWCSPVGLGVANGPASSGSTAAVSADEVGAASGISNMARYVGAAVAVAAVAMVNNAVTNNHREAGESASAALAAGLSSSALADGDLVRRRHRAHRAHGASPPPAHPRDRSRRRGSRERAHDPDRALDRLVTAPIRNPRKEPPCRLTICATPSGA